MYQFIARGNTPLFRRSSIALINRSLLKGPDSPYPTSEEVGLANNGWRVELPIVHLEPARIIRDGSASPAIAWSNLYFVTESDNKKLGVLVGVFHWNGVLGVLIAIFLYWDGVFVL